MAKRSCRRTDEENRNHDRAVKIRKMTDERLCAYIDSLTDDAGNNVNQFLSELNKIPGIGTTTMLQNYAKENGYIN